MIDGDYNSPWGELQHLTTVVNVIPYDLVCDIMACRELTRGLGSVINSGSGGVHLVGGGNDCTVSDSDQEQHEILLKRLSLQMDDYSDNLFTQMMELGHMSQIRRTMVTDQRVSAHHRLTEGRPHVMEDRDGTNGVGDGSVEKGLSNMSGVGVGVGAGIGVGGLHEEDLGVVARSVWQYLHHHHHHRGGQTG